MLSTPPTCFLLNLNSLLKKASYFKKSSRGTTGFSFLIKLITVESTFGGGSKALGAT